MRCRNASRRSVVVGMGGAVATSQPLAAQAGLQMLRKGGTAADAAVAAAATLNVVEPMSTGMGGDAFVLLYEAASGRVSGLNASGCSPAAATVDAFRNKGLEEMPARGILPVTVPGAPAGWEDLLRRYGRFGLDTVLAPAIGYARDGFPVSERISRNWQNSEALLQRYQEAARVFLHDGKAPRPGEVFYNPDLARSMEMLAERGPDVFYRGALAEAILRTSEEQDGLLVAEDLAEHGNEWVDPISVSYRGHRVYECPPNGQGVATLIALNILSGYDLADEAWSVSDLLHLKIEAVKRGLTDAHQYVTDPEHMRVPVDWLLSTSLAEERRQGMSLSQALIPQAAPDPHLDTVYVSAVDGEGNAVSFINSLYMGFGSGIVAEGTGIMLQNRGHLFSLDPKHINCVAPRKRTYHTIIPSIVTEDDALALCFGVVGGHMQPQGQVQVLTNLLDHGMNVQQALDAPRFGWEQGLHCRLEPYFSEDVYDDLRARGHDLEVTAQGNFGGGQIIARNAASGVLQAGSEPRTDGCAVAF